MRVALLLLLPLALGGCIAKTAVDVATMPVRAVGWTADKLTTSPAEADRNRGRALRKQEQRERKEAKRRARQLQRERDQIDGESSY